MNCTEEEAKKKQCRIPITVITQNNFLDIENCMYVFPVCIASGCMMWVWDEQVLFVAGHCGLIHK